MKICVVGLGYIGLPTAALFSHFKCEVVGVDVNSKIVDSLNEGTIHIEEPGLNDMIEVAIENRLFRASVTPEEADVYIIAVPTPNSNDQYLSCDLSHIENACESIIPFLRKGNVIIIESTIAPRSMEDFVKPIFEGNGYNIGEDLYLAHCPERVLPGQIINELVNNNRIVGGITKACTEEASKVYSLFVKGEILQTESKTAEMAKCIENAYRDVNIAFANELSKICHKLNINVHDVIEMANKHPRVNIHSPGPGVGGHCLAVDPYFIYSKAPEEARLIKASREINESMPQFVVDIVKEILSDIKSAKISVFGVSYKGDVSDVRESPSLKVISMLKTHGFKLSIYDPYVKTEEIVGLDESIQESDLILVLTDHTEFKKLDLKEVVSRMRTPILFDTKNIIKEDKSLGLKVLNFGNVASYKKSIKGEVYETVR